MKKSIKLSVHKLVDFLLRKGDIDNRIYNQDTMNEGTRIHSIYQSKQGPNYIAEHYLLERFEIPQYDYEVTIEGRADGIIKSSNHYIIDEIKSTLDDLENFHNEQEEWHLGQAKCYALMFAHEKGLEEIGVRLTYISQVNNEKKIFTYYYKTKELEVFINDLISRYLDFISVLENIKEMRNKSIDELKFPYTNFRPNQKQLSKYVYSVAKTGGTIYVEAPTGIGKTISTLYPYVKSLTLGNNEKIFYLTAKNSGKQSAYKAVSDMKKVGLKILDIIITAKEKICFCDKAACNPDECPFTKGYYSKLKGVVEAALAEYDSFDQSVIENIASRNNMCPFELQLDLSLFMDIIICDYNYMFDPITHMQRYFDDDSSKFIALIDEAHNLVERSKGMYSATLSNADMFFLEKELKGNKEVNKLKKQLTETLKLFESLRELPSSDDIVEIPFLYDIIKRLEKLQDALQNINKNHHEYVSDTFTNLSIDLNRFLRIYEFMDNSYLSFARLKENGVIELNLLCLDASDKVAGSIKKIRSATIFSATLSPYDYYITLLGGDKDNDPLLTIPSPFAKKKLKTIVVPNISTKYKNRDSTYEKVADYIKTFVKQKIGNYLVYLPSYEYLNKILEYIDLDDIDVIVQEKEMSDIDKFNFIENFVPNPIKTTVGFVIVGGSFAEGIDLVEDRLIGVVIVGVGLPQLSYEKNKEKEYFQSKGLNGYKYAYIYPGINKVYQAVGRLIRTEKDKGVALLIDDRYLTHPYLDMFENKLSNYSVATNKDEIIKIINEFWSN